MFNMEGENPIEYYYPDRDFGALHLVDVEPNPNEDYEEILTWDSAKSLNRLRGKRSPSTSIYEQQVFLRDGEEDTCGVHVKLRASWTKKTSGYLAPVRGSIKYAIVEGKFPSGLTLDIDTGELHGRMSDLDEVLSDELGLSPTGLEESAAAKEAAETFGFNYGEQSRMLYTENNYGTFGSGKLHRGGFGRPLEVYFTARAFDSDAPTTRYIDGKFTMNVKTNWSTKRDSLILNIRNQFFIDGKPVTNADYLATLKERGYFRDTCVKRKRKKGG